MHVRQGAVNAVQAALQGNTLIFHPGPFGTHSSVFLHREQMSAAEGKTQEGEAPQCHFCLIQFAFKEEAGQLISFPMSIHLHIAPVIIHALSPAPKSSIHGMTKDDHFIC